MKREYVNFILGISLAFNLAFIGMFVWHRMHRKPPQPRPPIENIRKSFGHNRKKFENIESDFIEYRHNFMEFIHSDEFNQEKADSLLSDMIMMQSKLERNIGNKMIELRSKGELPAPEFRQQPYKKSKPRRRQK